MPPAQPPAAPVPSTRAAAQLARWAGPRATRRRGGPPPQPLSPTGLATLGQQLYGSGWRSPLARTLGVSRSTIARWLAGRPIPPPAALAIRLLAAAGADPAKNPEPQATAHPPPLPLSP